MKKIKNRVNKLLSYKSNSYKRKYFLLSKFSNTNIKKNKKLLEEFKCYAKALNISDGAYPTEDSIVNLFERQIVSESNSIKVADKLSSNILKETNLKLNKGIETKKEAINSLLDTINLNSKRLNKKLEETLNKSIMINKSILSESDDQDKDNVVDLTKMPDSPSDEELSSIEGDDIDNIQTDEIVDIDYKDNDIVAYFGGKDPRKFNKKDYKKIFNIEPDRNYHAEINKIVRKISRDLTPSELEDVKKMRVMAKGFPVRSAEDQVNQIAVKLISKMSIEARKKHFIIDKMYRMLSVQTGSLKFLGLNEKEKQRHLQNLSDTKMSDSERSEKLEKIQDEDYETKQYISGSTEDLDFIKLDRSEGSDEYKKKGSFTTSNKRSRRSRSGLMSQEEISAFDKEIQDILLKHDYDLEDELLKVDDLLNIANRLFNDPVKLRQLSGDLDIMFGDNQSSSNITPLSQSEFEEYESENLRIDRELEDEASLSLEQDDYDPEVINVTQSAYSSLDEPETIMTELEYKEYQGKMNAYRKRIAQLNKKLEVTNPNIFAKFETDPQGNVIIEDLEDIPAEGLTPEEAKEYENIIAELSKSIKITVISLDQSGRVYEELYNNAAATPEDYAKFMKRFGLKEKTGPQKYTEIGMQSYGEMSGTSGPRQYALKAWFKGNHYSLSITEKSEIYSQLAQKWFDTLTTLDLVHDEAFRLPGAPKMPKLVRFFDEMQRYITAKGFERYFDDKGDESEKEIVREKINSAWRSAGSEQNTEFTEAIKKLEEEDAQFKRYAILDSLTSGNSSFRIYATTMLKEFYSKYIWSSVEEDLSYAIRDYFKANTRGGKIGASLRKKKIDPNTGKELAKAIKLRDIPKDEGKDLFGTIINVSMNRSGLPGAESYKQDKDMTTQQYQRDYISGNINNKGDFLAKIKAFNLAHPSFKIMSKDGSEFGMDDVDNLLDDMFNSSGIIGRVKTRMFRMTKGSATEFVTFLFDYDEGRHDQIVINSLAISNVLKRGADEMNIKIFQEVGKDTYKAFKEYKQKFARLLNSKDFAEYLENELGLQTVDTKSFGSKQDFVTTKSSL